MPYTTGHRLIHQVVGEEIVTCFVTPGLDGSSLVNEAAPYQLDETLYEN